MKFSPVKFDPTKSKPQKLIIILLILFGGTTYAQNFEEDVHYQTLSKPLATTVDKGKIEVRELFWYYCPHCADLEPFVNRWLKNKGDNVEFVLQPAIFSDRWVKGAVFYYVLEELNLLGTLHNKLFDAIHKDNIKFARKDSFIDWLTLNGVDRKVATKVFSSFHVRTKVNRAILASKATGVSGVPAFIINGRYSTSVREAGSQQAVFEVIDYLVKKSRRTQKPGG